MKNESIPEQVNIIVTPLMKQNGQIYCEIDPDGASHKYVKGGVIKLPDGQDYELTFEIADGDIPGLKFDPMPFSSSAAGCPTKGQNNGQFGTPQVKPGSSDRSCRVDVTPTKSKNVVHYGLHFSDGSSCDPIIINGTS